MVEVWCLKSGKWRTAGNIISCAWAQVTTRAAAGRTHNSMGVVRLRADSSGGFGGIGAASGRTGRRLALLFGGQSAAKSAAPPPPLPPSGNEYAATGRLTAAGPSVRRAAAGPPPGQLPRRACRSRARGSGYHKARGLQPRRASPPAAAAGPGWGRLIRGSNHMLLE